MPPLTRIAACLGPTTVSPGIQVDVLDGFQDSLTHPRAGDGGARRSAMLATARRPDFKGEGYLFVGLAANRRAASVRGDRVLSNNNKFSCCTAPPQFGLEALF